jgi:hypothetical protein
MVDRVMYTTCAFCNGKLDGDGGPSGLGVGKRLAFDEWRGRLWVICPKCTRWNLAPLDERLERVEALARAARDGRVAAASGQVALIRCQGYDLVRVGRPPRLEFATWRYGERLKARQRDQLKFVVPLTVATVGLAVAVNVAAGGSVGVFVWNVPNLARAMYTGIIGRRAVTLVEPPICERCGSVMRLRAKHVAHARIVPDAQTGLGLVLSCPSCHAEGAQLVGTDAQAALRQGLTYLALRRRGRERAADAARVVEGAGGPDRLIRDIARRELTLRSFAPDRRLALEMAVDEQAELAALECQWRVAEEIAEIADGQLSTTAEVEEELRRLKERTDRNLDQPSG